jgi:membrane-bound lytic murein transglycosylase A
MRRTLASIPLVLLLAAPAGALPTPPPPEIAAPALGDDGDQASLLQAVGRSRTWLAATTRKTVLVAGRAVPTEALRRGLADFEAIVRLQWGRPGFEDAVRERFEWVAMPGRDGEGAVHLTGYHQPMLEARTAPDATFRHPLYAPPADMIPLDLGAFRPSLAGQTAMARLKGGRILPYYTRREIDDGQALAGRGLEIAWVADARARASLMLQGSGQLRFEDGRVANVNFAGQNGHPFTPGDANPSYVFFKLAADGPFGCDGVPLTGGRAIATDKRLFGTGTLAWLAYPRARLDDKGAVTAYEPGGRYVLDQDTGGAVAGPGRADLFWGGGDEAARRAVATNGGARVWFLVPKAEQPAAPDAPAEAGGRRTPSVE